MARERERERKKFVLSISHRLFFFSFSFFLSSVQGKLFLTEWNVWRFNSRRCMCVESIQGLESEYKRTGTKVYFGLSLPLSRHEMNRETRISWQREIYRLKWDTESHAVRDENWGWAWIGYNWICQLIVHKERREQVHVSDQENERGKKEKERESVNQEAGSKAGLIACPINHTLRGWMNC